MTPAYTDPLVNLYRADSFTALDRLDVQADITITDVPYGARTKKGARGNRKGAGNTEAIIDFDAWSVERTITAVDLMARHTQRWMILFMDWEHVLPVKENLPKGWQFVRYGAWVKTNGAPQMTGDRPAMSWESIVFLHPRSKKRWNSGGHRGVWHHPIARPRDRKKRNKTEKPEGLIGELIMDFAEPGGLILDPFMGTGTTCVAAKRRGYPSVGIDVREVELEDAIFRCRQEVLPGVSWPTQEELKL